MAPLDQLDRTRDMNHAAPEASPATPEASPARMLLAATAALINKSYEWTPPAGAKGDRYRKRLEHTIDSPTTHRRRHTPSSSDWRMVD